MSDTTSGPSRWRRPGDRLRYADALAKLGEWPPRTSPGRPRNPDRPAASAFLVLPAFAGDTGTRPLPETQALRSAGIRLIDATGAIVPTALPGQSYRLQASIANLGATASYAGLIDFFIAPAAALEAAAAGGPAPPAFWRFGFTLPSQSSTMITTTKSWTPADVAGAASSLLARVFDLISDRLGNGFDGLGNRHVGRRDALIGFSGVWDGRSTNDGVGSFLFRVIIAQTGATAACQFFAQVSNELPNAPQSTGTGTVVGTQLSLTTTDHFDDGTPFTTNQWTLTLRDPATLHMENIHTFPPGDGRPPQHWEADLHRI